MTDNRPTVLKIGNCSQPLVGPLARGLNALGEFRVAALDPFFSGRRLDPEQELDYDPVVYSRSLGDGQWRVDGGGRIRAKLNKLVGQMAFRLESTRLLAPYSAIHWHGLFKNPYLCAAGSLRNDQKLLVSLWGSDLMRQFDPRMLKQQSRILERADLITTHGPELRQVLLAKFGWHLESKIRYALFGAGNSQLEGVMQLEHADARAAFLRKIGVDPSRRIVVIGHNGNPANRHREVIELLANLPADSKKGLELVVPATYFARAGYLDELSEAARQADLSIQLITEYMNDAEISMLRHASDILIFVPRSDAMSAALSQTMAAGNVVVAGAWLPYSAKRRAGIVFHEVDRLADLPDLVLGIARDFESRRAECSGNPKRILEGFSTSANIASWAAIYRELLKIQ